MTKITKKLVAFIIGVAFVLFAFSALAWATSGFRNWDSSTWFNSWGKAKPTSRVSLDPTNADAYDSRQVQSLNGGLVYDSDESEANVNVQKPDKPVVNRTESGFAFSLSSDNSLNCHIEVQLKDCSATPYGDPYISDESSSLIIPYTKIAELLRYSITAHSAKAQSVCGYFNAWAVSDMGIKSDIVTMSFTAGDYRGDIFFPNYTVNFDDTIVTIRSDCNAISLKIGVFPTDIQLPTTIADSDVLTSIPDHYNGSSSDCDAITFANSTYTIDLTKLSFASELNSVCTIIALPYGVDIQGGALLDSVGYVKPIRFSISKLATPSNITLGDDGILSWDPVQGARGYSVFCASTKKIVEENSISISEFPVVDGDNLFRIRALGNVGAKLSKTAELTPYNASLAVNQVVALSFDIAGDVVTKFVPFGNSVGAYLYDVDIPGQVFGGWYYDSGYSVKVLDTDILTSDTTVYARLSDAEVTERNTTWWERNKWYVLGPTIGVAVLALIIGVAVSLNKKK